MFVLKSPQPPFRKGGLDGEPLYQGRALEDCSPLSKGENLRTHIKISPFRKGGHRGILCLGLRIASLWRNSKNRSSENLDAHSGQMFR